MIGRRSLLLGAASFVALAAARARAEQPILTDDGLYKQPWFLESFLELADDLAAASAKNKRLAIMWELRGCPYCRETHLVNFAKPEIADYIKARFEILQLNIVGSREVTDFDGEKLSEKMFARKYGVRSVPTFQFFSDKLTGLSDKAPREREVARAQGYIEAKPFLDLFRFVADRDYEKGRVLHLPESGKRTRAE